MKKLILIDGNSLFFRAYYATNYPGAKLMQTKKGVYTNALFAFINMMDKILEEDFSHILVAFDTNKPTFRHQAYDGYKAGRAPIDPEMALQFPLMHDYLKYRGLYDYSLPGYEADDIIGTLSTLGKEGFHVDIYSSDKDLLQLVNDHVTVKILKRGMTDVAEMTPKAVLEEYGFSHELMVDYLGLMGDPSDNIPGIPGVGPVRAVNLLKTYGSLQGALDHADEIKGKLGESIRENKDLALFSYELATIHKEVPLEFDIDSLKYRGFDQDDLIKFYQEMEFHSFIRKLLQSEEAVEVTDTFRYRLLETDESIKSVLKPDMAVHIELFDDNYHTSDIVGFSLSDGKTHYFIETDVALNSKSFIDYLSSDANKYTYDIKAFKVALNWRGFSLDGISFDLLLASYLYDSAIAKSDFKVITSVFDYQDLEYDELVYGKGKKKTIPEEDVYQTHIAKKAKAIYKLRPVLEKKLKENELDTLYQTIELPLASVLADMEYQGIRVDLDELKLQKKSLKERIDYLEERIHHLAGKPFNINSPKQLGEVLFVDLGLETGKKTKTKGYSTNVEVLNSLKNDHPIISLIMDYRQLTKLYSTYIEGLEKTLFSDQKVHTIYAQALTSTGRLSSLEPNLQNIPVRTEEGRQIRKLFIPSDNHLFLAADYSQIELRVMAHMSNCINLIDDFNKGLDIHSETAKKVFETNEVTPLERHKAKAVNFGIIYGIGAWSLSEDIEVSPKEAQAFIDRYFEVYPEIENYMNETVDYATEHGYVKTIMNRRRYIPELKSPVYFVKALGKRTAMNAPIQGSAADIIKKAMIDLDKVIKKENLKSKLLLQVHDELILEVPKDEMAQMEIILSKVMNEAVKLKVSLKTSLNKGSSWYELD